MSQVRINFWLEDRIYIQLPWVSLYNFEIFTVANGRLYTLDYSEKLLKVPKTLPLANKTVESFKII